jgi:hypothetical protein
MLPPENTSFPSSIVYVPPIVLQPALALSDPSWKMSRIVVPATSGRGSPPAVTLTDRNWRPITEVGSLLAGGVVVGEAEGALVGLVVGGVVGAVVGGWVGGRVGEGEAVPPAEQPASANAMTRMVVILEFMAR